MTCRLRLPCQPAYRALGAACLRQDSNRNVSGLSNVETKQVHGEVAAITLDKSGKQSESLRHCGAPVGADAPPCALIRSDSLVYPAVAFTFMTTWPVWQ